MDSHPTPLLTQPWAPPPLPTQPKDLRPARVRAGLCRRSRCGQPYLTTHIQECLRHWLFRYLQAHFPTLDEIFYQPILVGLTGRYHAVLAGVRAPAVVMLRYSRTARDWYDTLPESVDDTLAFAETLGVQRLFRIKGSPAYLRRLRAWHNMVVTVETAAATHRDSSGAATADPAIRSM